MDVGATCSASPEGAHEKNRDAAEDIFPFFMGVPLSSRFYHP